MSSDYTPPTIVTPTPGGNAGDGQIAGGLIVETAGNGGATELHVGPRNDFAPSGLWIGSSDNSFVMANHAGGGIYIGYGGDSSVAIGQNQGLIFASGGYPQQVNGVSTIGLGWSPIYAAALRTALGTTSANLATYTPGAVGSFRVVWRLAAKAATTPTLTLTYTDPDAGAQTITLYDTAMAADGVAQGQFALVSAADAITVAGSALAASDIIATVEIIQSQ